MPAAQIALDPGDGRLVLLIDDSGQPQDAPAAGALLASIATWPEVLGTSLVYEYSGPDSPAPEPLAGTGFRAWRGSLAQASDPAERAASP